MVFSFKYFIHKFLEVYFDDSTVYGLVKDHIESLQMILERCRQFQISLIMKKCIFCAPFGILLGHVVCQEGILMEPTKKLRATLGNTNYYKHIIRGYVEISTPMENLLNKDVKVK